MSSPGQVPYLYVVNFPVARIAFYSFCVTIAPGAVLCPEQVLVTSPEVRDGACDLVVRVGVSGDSLYVLIRIIHACLKMKVVK